MYRAGWIVGAVALFVAAGAALLSPVCAPCFSIFLGLGAGYLAGVFDKPATSTATSKVGAIGGAIAGFVNFIRKDWKRSTQRIGIGPAAASKLF